MGTHPIYVVIGWTRGLVDLPIQDSSEDTVHFGGDEEISTDPWAFPIWGNL